MTFAANAYFAGSYYWQPDTRLRQPAGTDVNAKITWNPSENYSITAWVDNLFNRFYFTSVVVAAGADLAYYGEPRRFGIKLTVRY